MTLCDRPVEGMVNVMCGEPFVLFIDGARGCPIHHPGIPVCLRSAAAMLGRKGGAAGRGASKRRDVDYAALGRKGGQAGKGKRKPRK